MSIRSASAVTTALLLSGGAYAAGAAGVQAGVLGSALAATTSLAAEPAQTAAPASKAAAAGYVPTTADYLGVYDALQRYRFGVEKHDQAMQDSAFWEKPKPPSPPPGFVPPPGFPGGPPGPAGGASGGPGSEGFVDVWHLPLDSYIHFESATRATHYEYFLSIYPQPEKKVDSANVGNMQNTRTSIVGWPGHYDDILEKRNGEWRILQRKTRINEK
jgi:hypothetical protein